VEAASRRSAAATVALLGGAVRAPPRGAGP